MARTKNWRRARRNKSTSAVSSHRRETLLRNIRQAGRPSAATETPDLLGDHSPLGAQTDPPEPQKIIFDFSRPGFYMPPWRSYDLPQVLMENLCLALRLDEIRKIKPRLQGLLIVAFQIMYEMRDAYDVKDESMSSKKLFFSRVVPTIVRRGISGGGFKAGVTATDSQRTIQQLLNPLQYLKPGTLVRLTDIYVTTRIDFRDLCVDKERLVLKKRDDVPMRDAGDDDDDDDDDDEMDGEEEEGRLVVVEDHGSEDEAELLVREKLEHRPMECSKRDRQLISVVDQWIDWVEEQKGNDINPSLLDALQMV